MAETTVTAADTELQLGKRANAIAGARPPGPIEFIGCGSPETILAPLVRDHLVIVRCC
jgi:hypothetical protein